MPSAGLYIHIPFCNIKCIYCDFYSVVDQEKTIPKFLKHYLKKFNHAIQIQVNGRSIPFLLVEEPRA